MYDLYYIQSLGQCQCVLPGSSFKGRPNWGRGVEGLAMRAVLPATAWR